MEDEEGPSLLECIRGMAVMVIGVLFLGFFFYMYWMLFKTRPILAGIFTYILMRKTRPY